MSNIFSLKTKYKTCLFNPFVESIEIINLQRYSYIYLILELILLNICYSYGFKNDNNLLQVDRLIRMYLGFELLKHFSYAI